MNPPMTITDRVHALAPGAPNGWPSMASLLRIALLCLVVATSGACSFVEELQPGDTGYQPPFDWDDDGGIGDDDDGPVIPDVVPYAARWRPSPSDGVSGYRLDIDVVGGGDYRTVNIPLAAATLLSRGRLSYPVDLETDNDYELTLYAYGSGMLSAPSNTIIVTGSDLIADASAASAAPSAAMASSVGAAMPTSSSDDASSTAADEGVSAAADDGETGSDATAVAEGEPRSLAFDGSGAHLAGAIDDLVGDAALTLSAWLRPSVDGDAAGGLFSVASDADESGLDVAVEGADVRVSLHDATGGVVFDAVFADALVHDVWQHAALVFELDSDAPLRLVVAGETLEPASVDATAGIEMPDSLSGALRVGDGYTGRLGHMAVLTRALSDAELDALDAAGHASDLRGTDGLMHYWRLGEGASVEVDLGEAAWSADLVATDDGVVAVADAPSPIE